MPRFKVIRTKQYVTYIEANTPASALDRALDLKGSDWVFEKDDVQMASWAPVAEKEKEAS